MSWSWSHNEVILVNNVLKEYDKVKEQSKNYNNKQKNLVIY